MRCDLSRFFIQMIKQKSSFFFWSGLLLLPAVALAQSGDLKEIMFEALNSDPAIGEARANANVAATQVDISRAGHYPVVSLTGRQVLTQKHDYSSNDVSSGLGVRGSVNLYSWGGIEASVERDEHKYGFYRYKYDETREQVGKSIGELYLTALRAKENIAVYQEGLARLNKILQDLAVIVRYDPGRRSERTEAEARALQVQTILVQQQQLLQTSLSQLSRYTNAPIDPNTLRDPFAGMTPQMLVQQYKSPDLTLDPSYLAQKEELERNKAQIDVDHARRLPAVNLESSYDKTGYEVYVSLQWDVFNPAARYTVQQDRYNLDAAQAKLDQILRDIAEKSQTSEINMSQSLRRMEVAQQQIVSQREVVRTYELQYKIARRTLIDVLNAYKELSSIEAAEVDARNNFRDAALAYLVAQARVAAWAGITDNADTRP